MSENKITFPAKLASNNPQSFGIVDATEISGHRSVDTLSDLYSISDSVLSVLKDGSDAIGQEWFVVSEDCKYRLDNWKNRKSVSGWIKLPKQELINTKQSVSEKDQPSGYAGLDSNGKIPIEKTYGTTATVTDVATYESLPVAGSSGVIYYVSNTSAQYKWSGSAYVDITDGADNAKKNETSIFDCSNGTSTKYYSSLSEAINVVPPAYRTSNRIISYLSTENSTTSAVNYQYHGINSTTWTDLAKWERVPNQADLAELRSDLSETTDKLTELEREISGRTELITTWTDGFIYDKYSEASTNSSYQKSAPIHLLQEERIIFIGGGTPLVFALSKVSNGQYTKLKSYNSTDSSEIEYTAESDMDVIISSSKESYKGCVIYKNPNLSHDVSTLKNITPRLAEEINYIDIYIARKYEIESSIMSVVGGNANTIIDYEIHKGDTYVVNINSNGNLSFASVRTADSNWNKIFEDILEVNGTDTEVVALIDALQIRFACMTDGVVSSGEVGFKIRKKGISIKDEINDLKEKGDLLFGAGFFGAWRGVSGYGDDAHKSSRSYLAYASSNIYNPNKPWVEVYKDMYGEYPSKPVSFSMAFAGKNVQYQIQGEDAVDLLTKKSRIPVKFPLIPRSQFMSASESEKYSWSSDSIEAMEAQIELAFEKGIDYFQFCFYPVTNTYGVSIFDHNDNFIDDYESILQEHLLNKDLFSYLQCKNKDKVKMVICLEAQEPVEYIDSSQPDKPNNIKSVFADNPIRQRKILKYVYNTFIKDNDSYLYVDGMPVVALFNTKSQFNDLYVLQMRGLTYAMNANVVNNTFGKMQWGVPTQKRDVGSTFYELNDYCISLIDGYRNGTMNLYALSSGWDRRQLLDFEPFNSVINKHVGYAEAPTKQELKNEIIDAVTKCVTKGKNVLISIFAWNEFGEGGFLVPTKEDGLNSSNDYYNFDKLDAVAEAKEYVLSKYISQ